MLFKGGEDQDCSAIGTSSSRSPDTMDINISADRGSDLNDFSDTRVINTTRSKCRKALADIGKEGEEVHTRHR